MSSTKTQNQIDTLIEQAIQGHAGTRDAMRWLAAQVRSAALDDAAALTEEVGRLLDGNATPTPNETAAAIRALKGTT